MNLVTWKRFQISEYNGCYKNTKHVHINKNYKNDIQIESFVLSYRIT